MPAPSHSRRLDHSVTPRTTPTQATGPTITASSVSLPSKTIRIIYCRRHLRSVVSRDPHTGRQTVFPTTPLHVAGKPTQRPTGYPSTFETGVLRPQCPARARHHAPSAWVPDILKTSCRTLQTPRSEGPRDHPRLPPQCRMRTTRTVTKLRLSNHRHRPCEQPRPSSQTLNHANLPNDPLRPAPTHAFIPAPPSDLCPAPRTALRRTRPPECHQAYKPAPASPGTTLPVCLP
ncbi:unnamed protein product [Boreogadus saida]